MSPADLEACNGRDDDCDGATDEPDAIGSGTWYADSDGDGYGDAAAVDRSCERPSGYSATSGDCDDTRGDVNPHAAEVCATPYDDDCDGDAAERNTSDCDRWYLDFDEDGHGSTSSICACDAEDGYTSTDRDDCDDGDPDVSPDAAEIPGNGVDDDCDDAPDALLADSARASFHGDDRDDAAGSSLGGGADVDGDGRDDVLVGAPGDDLVGTDAGMAFLVLAPAAGNVSSDDADVRLMGEGASDEAGAGVALGDIDGDGYADALVGAPGSRAGGRGSGVAYLLQGPLVSADLGSADLTLPGAAASDGAGSTVCLPGDVDGDGIGDLLIGAPTATVRYARAGRAHLVLGGGTGTLSLGAADATISGGSTNDRVGGVLAPAGDVDGDGTADFWLGVWAEDIAGSDSGAAYLVLGPVSGSLTLGAAATSVLLGASANDGAGGSVTGVGDVDGDGHPDVLVGAPDADGGGAAYFVRGPFTAASTSLSAADAIVVGVSGDLVGTAVTSPGDVDGDGAPDLLIGAPGNADNGADAGAAWLFVGAPSGTVTSADAWLSYWGAASDGLGEALAPVGDWDGDGVPDLLVGAPGSTQEGNTGAGAAYLFLTP